MAETSPSGSSLWIDREGRPGDTIGQPQEALFFPSLSHGDTRVAVDGSDQGNVDVWILDAVRGTNTRLTFDEAVDYGPVWSPDDERIAFISPRNGNADIFLRAADGSGEAELLVTSTSFEMPFDWTRDGKTLVYMKRTQESKSDLWMVPLDGDRTPLAILQGPSTETAPVLSPDERYVAYQSDESGRNEIYVTRFPSGGGRWQVSVDGGIGPRWVGGEIFYVGDNTMMAVRVETGSSFRAGTPIALFTGQDVGTDLRSLPVRPGYDVSSNGQRFVMGRPVGDEDETTPVIMVVENWYSEFEDNP